VTPVTTGIRLPPDERGTMTQPPVTSRSSGGSRSQIAAHPVISAVIAILVIATIFFSLYVPLYASATPKVGDFPFFYFYLLVYMPVVGIALGIVIMLQNRLRPVEGAEGRTAADMGEVTK
jgi:hypothetical protein